MSAQREERYNRLMKEKKARDKRRLVKEKKEREHDNEWRGNYCD